MKTKIAINHIKLSPVIGIGFWKDVYNFEDINGYAYNIILPFVRIQVGTLFKNN